MQVNANSQVQPTNPLEGLIADKTSGQAGEQSAKEAFAAVLAKAGLNVQAGVSASLQAPVTLSKAVDKQVRVETKETVKPEPREHVNRAVSKNHDDGKTGANAKADDVRAGNRPEPKAPKADNSDDDAQQAAGANEAPEAPSQDAAPKADADAGKDAKAPNDQTAASAGEGKTALVADAEENVTIAMGAIVAQPVQQAALQVQAVQADASDDGSAIVQKTAEGPVVQLAAASQVQKPAEVKHQAALVQDMGPKETEEAVQEAVLVLGQAVKAVVQKKGGEEAQTQTADYGKDSLQGQQAAMLSAIVGDKGTAKVEVSAKTVHLAQQSASALSVGLLASETQTQQAVMAAAPGFGEEAGQNANFAQNNAGQQISLAPQAVTLGGAQLGAEAALAAQGPATSFQAALTAVQAGAGQEGPGEVQGVQGAGGAQAASQGPAAAQGAAQAQGAQENRAANAAQSAEKPHEAKAPQQAKEILDQVNVQISKAAKEGLDKITVQMRPEALGRVEVQLKLGDGGQLSAHIIADRQETLDALKRDSGELSKSLADAGFKTDQGALQFSLRGEHQNNQQQAENGKTPSFFDRAQALDEAAPEETIAAARPRAASRSGVDISV
jgi:hypothetical protein